jgi:hypothetical protein
LFLAYANDYIGYVVPAEAFAQAATSHVALPPEAEGTIVEASTRVLREVMRVIKARTTERTIKPQSAVEGPASIPQPALTQWPDPSTSSGRTAGADYQEEG